MDTGRIRGLGVKKRNRYMELGIIGLVLIAGLSLIGKNPIGSTLSRDFRADYAPDVLEERVSIQKSISTTVVREDADIQNSEELVAWMKKMMPEHEQEVLEYLSGIDPFAWDTGLILSGLLEYYAGNGSVFDAIESLETLRAGGANFLFSETVAELLGSHSKDADPVQLLEFLERPENREIAQAARHEVGGEMLEGAADPIAVIEMIKSAADDSIRQSLMNGALEKWAVDDLEGMLDYLVSVPEAASLDRGNEKASFYLRQISPQYAVVFAMRIQNEEVRNASVAYAAIQLLERDPDLYASWMSGLKDTELFTCIQEKVDEFNGSF